MKKKWSVESNGVTHNIEFKQSGFGSKLIIDGQTHKIKSANWFIFLVDYAINFGDTECRLVVIGNKSDLAVNGQFLGSNEPYVPINNTPAWVYVLVGLSTIGGYFFSGLFGMVIGIFMSSLYIRLGLKKKIGPLIGAFIGCTAIQLLIFFILLKLNSAI